MGEGGGGGQSSARFLLAGCTTAPPRGVGSQPPRWKRQEWCSPTFSVPGTGDIRAQTAAATRGPGMRQSLMRKMWTPHPHARTHLLDQKLLHPSPNPARVHSA